MILVSDERHDKDHGYSRAAQDAFEREEWIPHLNTHNVHPVSLDGSSR